MLAPSESFSDAVDSMRVSTMFWDFVVIKLVLVLVVPRLARLVLCCTQKDRAATVTYPIGLRTLNLGNVLCCKNRQARWVKCQKRCWRRRRNRCRQQQQGDEAVPEATSTTTTTTGDESLSWLQMHLDMHRNKDCPLQRFYKMHLLPPPLPCNGKCKKQAAKIMSADTADVGLPIETCRTNVFSSGSVPPLDTSRGSQSADGSVAEEADAEHTATTTTTSPHKPERRRERGHRRRHHHVTPALLNACRMQQWEAVTSHLNKHDAKYQDADGLYPLHWACSGGPPVLVISQLVRWHAAAVGQVDSEGSTALHFATHYSAALPVLETLYAANPGAVSMQDKYGRTPLYHAVHKCASIDILQFLVTAHPGMATVPCLPNSSSAFAAPPDITMMPRGTAIRTPLYLVWAQAYADRHVRVSCRGKKWDKAVLLLAAAHRHARNAAPAVPRNVLTHDGILASAIALDVYLPEQALPLIVQAYPEQLRQASSDTGQLPLSLAAATVHYTTQRAQEMLHVLLTALPAAARHVDHHGNTALSLALGAGQQRWSLVVERLWRAAPQVLTDSMGLPPVLAAAAACRDKNTVAAASPDAAAYYDPYGLLGRKQREFVLLGSVVGRSTSTSSTTASLTSSSSESNDDDYQHDDDDAVEHLDTIFQLMLRAPTGVLGA